MTGLVKQTWQICGIVFVLLLPYIVLRRRLWFPGMVSIAYSTFAHIELFSFMGSPVRVQLVLIVAGLLIIGTTLMEKKWHAHPLRPSPRSWLLARTLLVVWLFFMGLRLAIEYVFTGLAYLPGIIVELVASTLLPCLIVLVHPAREDALQEVLRGIALGALLALVPAFTDFEELSGLWRELVLGSVVPRLRIGYRDRNTLASWAVHGAVALFYLVVLKRTPKGSMFSYALVICLAAFAVLTQSRRWTIGIAFSAVSFFVVWLGNREAFSKDVRSRRAGTLLLGLIVGSVALFSLYQVFRIQSRFERLAVDVMLLELGPSEMVLARSSRGDLWRLALSAWREGPLFGVGLSGFGWNSSGFPGEAGGMIAYHIGAHSLPVDVLVQYGLVGAVLGIIFLLAMLRCLVEELRPDRPNRLRKELLLLTIYWLSLFPVAAAGGWNPHNLQILAVLPCVAGLVVMGHVERAGLKGSLTGRSARGGRLHPVMHREHKAGHATGIGS